MKIAFVLINHPPADERIWFQEAEILRNSGCEITIVSTQEDTLLLPCVYCFDSVGISKREVIRKIASVLLPVIPDVIICDNPIAVLAARHYKKQVRQAVRIIYDVTEWYPAYNNLRGLSFMRQVIKSFLLTALSFYSALFLSGFIFGEYYKALPFRIFFPWKKHIYLPYYADVDKVKVYPVNDISKKCILLYAGNLTARKGFDAVLNVAKTSAGLFPDISFVLRILSGSPRHDFGELPANIVIQFIPYLPFPAFCEEIGKADICFDLRKINMESTHCLPIKIFYYMAAGRPVIYSDLKAIRREIPEINKFGHLVDPENRGEIISLVSRYIKDGDYYRNSCVAARRLAEEKYDWRKINHRLITFIKGN
ncbi:MAG: hypothetical protein LBE71_00500 [Dysgonamonadaceae bacterium]|jgi:glycosyltransferase involved in cell wall biosynthesis|nr:hypothetical protein [Dysgonamonadaceae bacterium]